MRAAFLPVLLALHLYASAVHADSYLSMSGKELYERFCASCHGLGGHGDGPVSKFFKVEVPDLTLIARRHGGKYSYDQIERIIDGNSAIQAHGTRTMPVWGEEFARAESKGADPTSAAKTLIERLSDYLWSLQTSDAFSSPGPTGQGVGDDKR